MTAKCLPFGPPSPHILQSHGADTHPLKFYNTEYSTKYGQENFIPHLGKHQGTGYKSNFRPGVYYNWRLDELDDPVMGWQVADNYASTTRKHFLPVCGSNGTDPFARDLVMRSSGFVKDTPMTISRSHQIKELFIDKHGWGTVYPKHIPYLQHIQAKDPTSLENLGYGPSYMSTENHTRYLGLPNIQINTSRKSVGRKQGSGFTHAYNDEPITYRPQDAYDTNNCLVSLSRPTGTSVMKTSFLPSALHNGKEKLPILARNSERGTGFTREAMGQPAFYTPLKENVFTELEDVHPIVQERIRRENPTEFLNLKNPHNKHSIMKETFTGQQQIEPSLAQRLGNSTIGDKEMTGFTENNGQYFEQFETPQALRRFKTHYGLQFKDVNPKGEARYGRTNGDVMEVTSDGFTKSSSLHNFGPPTNTTKQLQRLEPFVARSIKARDPLFDDHTHDAKLHVINEA